jgi:hypothetical protein
MLAGSIANDKLSNSAITIAGTSTSLGGSIAADDIIGQVSSGQITNSQLANAGITIAGNSTALGGSISQQTIFEGSTAISSSMSVTALSDVSSAGSGAIITTAERSKLTGIEAGADVTDTANVTAAGALMDSEVTNLAQVKAFDSADYATAAQGTKADAALPEADVDADIKTLSLPANTTISTFGASLVDDADASAARTTLGVDAAGTDNSTDVTLAGTRDYITISGQTITRNQIDISDDTNLAVGTGVTLTGDTLSIGQDVSTSANVVFADITATGDLTVQGELTSLQTTNLNIEDQFILLNSGSSEAASQGIIFGGTTGTQGSGEAFFYDRDADRPAWSRSAIAWNATDAAETAFIPRVFDLDGSSHVAIAEVGSIQISGGDIFIYG